MINQEKTDELIERFLRDELSPEELQIFNQWHESDDSLLLRVEEMRTVLSAISGLARRKVIREKLDRIHEEMVFDASVPVKLKVVHKHQPAWKQFYFRHRFISIAAAVSVIAISGTLITAGLAGMFSSDKQSSIYVALRKEVENLKRNQKAIIRDINENKVTEEPVTGHGVVGTGFALTSDGYILTSYHVVNGARAIYVSNSEFEQLHVKEVAAIKELDLCILKVDDEAFNSFGELPYSLRKSVADPGEKIYTLGFPREDIVYGEGSVSSYTGFEGDTASYQISIPVNPGNSGGPLFDSQGNLIGIISGKNTIAEGAAFAIKSRHILHYLDSVSNDLNLQLANRKNLKSMDRPSQVKKLRDYVFMVKVFN